MKNKTLGILTTLAIAGGALFVISKSNSRLSQGVSAETALGSLAAQGGGGFNGFNPSGGVGILDAVTNPVNDLPDVDMLAPNTIGNLVGGGFPVGQAPPPRVINNVIPLPPEFGRRDPRDDFRQTGTGSTTLFTRDLR